MFRILITLNLWFYCGLSQDFSVPIATSSNNGIQIDTTIIVAGVNSLQSIDAYTRVRKNQTSALTGFFSLEPFASQLKVIPSPFGITLLESEGTSIRTMAINLKKGLIDQQYFFSQNEFDTINDGQQYVYFSQNQEMGRHIFYTNNHFFMNFQTLGMAMIVEDKYKNNFYVKRIEKKDKNLYIWSNFDLQYTYQKVHDSNFDVDIRQMVMAGHGYYIVGINQAIPAVRVYCVPLKIFVFQETLHSSEVYLKKQNQTHVIVAIQGMNTLIKVYDLRNFNDRLDFAPNFPTPQGFDEVFLFQGNASLVLMLTDRPGELLFFGKQSLIGTVKKQIDPESCYPPATLYQSQFCVLCDESCHTCYLSNMNRCSSCSLGFKMGSNLTCVPNQKLKIFHSFISTPIFKDIFQSSESFFLFMDRLWLLQYCNMTFSPPLKAIFRIIRKTNQRKFFPTFLENQQSQRKEQFLFPPPNQTGRESLAPPMYLLISKKIPYMLGYGENVYIWGIITTIIAFIGFRLIQEILEKNDINTFLAKYKYLGILVMQIIAPRISFITFHAVSELLTPVSVNFYEKASLMLSVILLFFVIAYCMTFYLFVRWLSPTEDKTVYYCLFFKNKPLTFVYFMCTNILLMLQSSFHAFFHFNIHLQLFSLMLVTCCNFALLVKCFHIFQSLGQFFIYLFHQVSRFLFLMVLLFDSTGETKFFQVDIQITELLIFSLLIVFLHLQVFSNYSITIIRIYKKFKKDKAQNQEQNNASAVNESIFQLIQEQKKQFVNRRLERDQCFVCSNNLSHIAIGKNNNEGYDDILYSKTERKKMVVFDQGQTLKNIKDDTLMRKQTKNSKEHKDQIEEQSQSNHLQDIQNMFIQSKNVNRIRPEKKKQDKNGKMQGKNAIKLILKKSKKK